MICAFKLPFFSEDRREPSNTRRRSGEHCLVTSQAKKELGPRMAKRDNRMLAEVLCCKPFKGLLSDCQFAPFKESREHYLLPGAAANTRHRLSKAL